MRLLLRVAVLLGLTGSLVAAGFPGSAVFRFPHKASFSIAPETPPATSDRQEWLQAMPAGRTNASDIVEFGDRVVVQPGLAMDFGATVQELGCTIARSLPGGVHVLQCRDALDAWRVAADFAGREGVLAAYPVVSHRTELNGAFAPAPTDSFYNLQWQLEHRNADGSSAGVDLNVRAAWPVTMGQGVTVAIADSGMELAHPELKQRVAGSPHFNFDTGTTNAGPVSGTANGAHGTMVAGLVAASLNDFRMTGVAPRAQLASWVIYRTNFATISDEKLMDLYQSQGDAVWVQNHSWGHAGLGQNSETLLERLGISNATHVGRSGRGVVLVRSAGNDRDRGGNANDDGYASDPDVVTVAAVRMDGRTAGYSEPGACVLVAAPSGDLDAGFQGLFTTDLTGSRGVNQISFFPPYQDLSDYVFNNMAFSGTSASAPLISGVVALMLSANPQLSVRDVQQILLLSARQFDLRDADIVTNGGGLRVSHNTGYGVPDAARAVELADLWKPRPPRESVVLTNSRVVEIPDNGLRFHVTGNLVPPDMAFLDVLPGLGPHADEPTPAFSLVDGGYGTNFAGLDLTNRAVLIQRGGGAFAGSITLAALAGARLAVVYNFLTNSDPNTAPGGEQLTLMGGTDFTPIPSAFIGHTDGLNLLSLSKADPTARVQLGLNSASCSFAVTNTLSLEHVGLRVRTDHPLRGDLRITLVSPAGTRSVLQRFNSDVAPGPVDWTYYSTHHFYESSAGRWTAFFSDEAGGAVGNVQEVDLVLTGLGIEDIDLDGLDDRWESRCFGDLSHGPAEDADQDGDSNLLEQLLGSDPTVASRLTPVVDLSRWNSSMGRLSWAGSPWYDYEVWSGPGPALLTRKSTIQGAAPSMEFFVQMTTSPQFFRVLQIPRRGTGL